MQTPENNLTPVRRAADQQQYNLLQEIMKTQQQILSELQDMRTHNNHVDEAFVLNDLNKPDYHGHRADHLERMKQAKVLDSYKQEATKKVLAVLAAFVLGLIATGFLETLKVHLK